MARLFDIPEFYRSPLITRVKRGRQEIDPRKRDLSPAVLDFGPVVILLARHFGFCFGVENAIEIAYQTLEKHEGDRVYFLSEMIHNPDVNRDLESSGVEFLFTPSGDQIVDWDTLSPEDVVVVPAFGTTLEIQEALAERGIDPYTYNTTCPFVEKVWKRSAELGADDYTVIVHGKANHEETRATVSHSDRNAKTVVVRDQEEAGLLCAIIRGDEGRDTFDRVFRDKSSKGFDPDVDLRRIGVVNQTTMLAAETHEISQQIRDALATRYGEDQIDAHFADTSDTLCYATNENQNATYSLVESSADLSLVVGGYNSSNTSHIVELCEARMPTYFVKNADEIESGDHIRHFSLESREVVETEDWLPAARPITIALTCGASCPDAVVEGVLNRVLSFFPDTRSIDEVLDPYPVVQIES
ncbi:TPA: 4-hydroxy-3-methylbut-2-enyl diphosphate reductase [Candidatus Latescibacteria bacterium]|nr:4-hydroxy-3-methylbut-2-enyl diphosphate reductase [Candidatus Latescibacterota bacterium]